MVAKEEGWGAGDERRATRSTLIASGRPWMRRAAEVRRREDGRDDADRGNAEVERAPPRRWPEPRGDDVRVEVAEEQRSPVKKHSVVVQTRRRATEYGQDEAAREELEREEEERRQRDRGDEQGWPRVPPGSGRAPTWGSPCARRRRRDRLGSWPTSSWRLRRWLRPVGCVCSSRAMVRDWTHRTPPSKGTVLRITGDTAVRYATIATSMSTS